MKLGAAHPFAQSTNTHGVPAQGLLTPENTCEGSSHLQQSLSTRTQEYMGCIISAFFSFLYFTEANLVIIKQFEKYDMINQNEK